MKPDLLISVRSSRPRRRALAFTLIEMMVTVTLLTFIIIGLVSMFGFTQRAFRSGMTQSDVLEAGRSAMDLVIHDVEMTAPTMISGVTNFNVELFGLSTNRVLGLPTRGRTNALEAFSFLAKENERWACVGYVVASPDLNTVVTGVGSLYRWQYPRAGYITNKPGNLISFLPNAGNAFSNQLSLECGTNTVGRNLSTNFTRICDGVVHLRVRAYSPPNIATNAGLLILDNIGTNIRASTNNDLFMNYSNEAEYAFKSNAVPAFVDIELGLLENETLKKYNALPNNLKAAFLARETTMGHIQLFYRRVPIRTVQNQAYYQ